MNNIVILSQSLRHFFRGRVGVGLLHEWFLAPTMAPPDTLDEAKPFNIAGLWNEFVCSDGEIVLTHAVITVEANSVVRVHNRMPAIIPIKDDQAVMRWLFDPEWPLDLLEPYPAEDMVGWRVSDAAKRSRPEQGRHLIELVEDQGRQEPLL